MIELTKRESEVLYGISHGRTSKQIAKNLNLSDHTVITYRKILFQKLEVMNAPALVRKGFEMGFLKSESYQQIEIKSNKYLELYTTSLY